MPIQKRLPAKERIIAEINPRNDIRVRITGMVIGKFNNTLVIDDGSKEVEITFNESIGYLNVGQLIRVIARVMPSSDGFQCIGECIQNLDDFDINLYKKAKTLV